MRARAWAVLAALGLAALSCSSDRAGTAPQGRSPSPDRSPAVFQAGITPHAAPGTEDHELAGLASTESTARVLAATIDDRHSVALVDVGTARAVTVPVDEGPLDPAVLTPDGAAVATAPRAIALLDREGGAVATAGLPPEVPGTIFGLYRARAGLVVDVVPRDADGRPTSEPPSVVFFDFRGHLRCVGRGFAYGTSTADHLWSDDLRTRLDVRTCRTTAGLRPDRGRYAGLTATGTATYALVGDDRVGRFGTRNGRLERRSDDLGGLITGVAASHGLWVLVDDRLLRLDEGSLEVRDRVYRFPCPEGGQVLAGRSSVYVVSCSAGLYEFDAETGSVVDAWALPSDRLSDQEPWPTMTADGIWIVDPEQSGEPFLFDVRRRRFERMPLDEGLRSRIYALVFDVMG